MKFPGPILSAFLTCMLVSGCASRSRSVYADFKSPSYTDAWDPLDELVFKTEIPGASGACDVVLTVRHTDSYPSQELRLIVGVHDGNAGEASDTVVLRLADEEGRWLGKTSYGVVTMTDTLRRGIIPTRGGMITVRPDSKIPVSGISKIGISLETR